MNLPRCIVGVVLTVVHLESLAITLCTTIPILGMFIRGNYVDVS